MKNHAIIIIKEKKFQLLGARIKKPESEGESEKKIKKGLESVDTD